MPIQDKSARNPYTNQESKLKLDRREGPSKTCVLYVLRNGKGVQTLKKLNFSKLMRFGSPNRIEVVESNLKSEFDRRITTIRIPTIQSTRQSRIRYKFDLFSIYF